MKKNSVQFAVVREDPDILVPFIKSNNIEKLLMICSGGCNALTYQYCVDNLKIDLIDFNESQINLTKGKVQKLIVGDFKSLDELNCSGNFESLFRQLSSFLFEFVMDRELFQEFFQGKIEMDISKIFSNPYWDVAFELFFSDIVLNTMFGPDATQHAPKGSYPKYFKKRLESALTRKDYRENYFLHHFFLDGYLENHKPTYYKYKPDKDKFNYIHGLIDDSLILEDYDFIDISNILDWMNDGSAHSLLNNLSKMKSGAFLVFRQLNNQKSYEEILSKAFTHLQDESYKFTSESRSMFYEKISVYKKI